MTKPAESSQPFSDSAVVAVPEAGAVSPSFPVEPPRRSKTGLIVALVSGGIIAAVAGVGVARLSDANRRAEASATVFAPGVKVADIALAGMSKEDGADKVRAWAKDELTTKTVALVTPESHKRYLVPLSMVGGRFDTEAAIAKAFAVGKDETAWTRLLHGDKAYNVNVTPEFKIDEKALAKQIESVGTKIAIAPVNARAEMVDGMLQVTKAEQKGIALDVPATEAAVMKNGAEGVRDGEEVTMVIKETEPKVTSENLGSVNTLLASYTTSFGSSSAARQSNIRKAAGKMNGTLLAPGETFSYNDIVGPRLTRLGWRDAPTYQDGQVVPGPGGGICQTSTTLYNAVLRANLKVVERRNHSMPVHYVDPGCDATVDYGSTDFKFQNNTDGPVYVEARTPGGQLTFNIFGIHEAYPGKIDVVTGRHSSNASGGFSVSSYKVLHAPDGTTTRSYIDSSYYRPFGGSSTASTPTRPRRRRSRPAAKPTAPTAASTPAPVAQADTSAQ